MKLSIHGTVIRLAGIAIALATGTIAAQLSDADIQNAIDAGRKSNVKAIWKSIEKNRTVRINRQGFGDTVGKKAVFLTDADTIELAAADAARRHQVMSVDRVRSWPNPGTIHVLLIAEAGGMYIMNLPKWQAPDVHMTLTVNGQEIQPSSEGAAQNSETKILPTEHGVVTNHGGFTSYTPLYQTAVYDVARSSTWFAFRLPDGAANILITVISSDGHEKAKDFDGAVLNSRLRWACSPNLKASSTSRTISGDRAYDIETNHRESMMHATDLIIGIALVVILFEVVGVLILFMRQ